MPGIIRRTLGTADKVRDESDKGWECFLEKQDDDDQQLLLLQQQANATTRDEIRSRRKRRRTSVATTTKLLDDLMNDCNQPSQKEDTQHNPPKDLLVDGSGNDLAKDSIELKEPKETETVTPSAATTTDSSVSGIPPHLTNLATSISQIQHTLGELVGIVTSHNDSNSIQKQQQESFQQRQEEALSRMEVITSRFEAAVERQNSTPPGHIQELISQIQKLQQEAHERNAIILALQQSQEEERRESQQRMAEALQRLTVLQAEKDVQSAPTTFMTTTTNKATSTTTSRSSNVTTPQEYTMSSPIAEPVIQSSSSKNLHPLPHLRRLRSSVRQRKKGEDDSSSMDTFGTPLSHQNDYKSDDSPFSTGRSISSSVRAVVGMRRNRKITPGASLVVPRNKTLKDLVPHYPSSYR